MGLDFETMQDLQNKFQEKHKGKWEELCPKVGRDRILWMIIEAGEMADVIKKRGDDRIMQDEETRKHFIEEMCDTLMFFNDVMLCYQITPEELTQAYYAKFDKNLGRW